MLRNFMDRTACDARLFALVFAATALSFACGSDDDKDEADDAADFTPTSMGPAANGVAFPMGVQDWLPIGAVARSDNGGSVRVIVGNQVAVQAARSGQTNPWPEGTMLSHLVWSAERNPVDPATVGPGNLGAVTVMVKDSSKYAADGNWAYGVWMGEQLMPPAATDFDRACVNCHTSAVADRDYVFTEPGALPAPATIAGAGAGANGVEFPDQLLDWRVIGIADILGANPQLRVIVGNPTAVDAARSGRTNPWPDGSRISHYVWGAAKNERSSAALPNNTEVLAPTGFGAFTLIQRSSANYGDDGNWAYGRWAGADLTPIAEGGDRACVDCHTERVSDRDMIFTEVAKFPPMMMTPPTIAR